MEKSESAKNIKDNQKGFLKYIGRFKIKSSFLKN